MTSPEGTPIWYELLSNDAEASKAFYESVLGWNVNAAHPEDAKGYRTLDTGHGLVGGLMQLSDAMRANGAKPTWLFYIGVDDVDASVAKVKAEGGSVLMEPFDQPMAGRIAMVADPQGIPFYVMRGASEGDSTAFERTGMGKCNWHELSTPDQAAGNRFYEKVFGWSYPDKMAMPGGAEYVFAVAGNTTFGATMPATPGTSTGWRFYFRAPDIDAAVEAVKKGGGKVHAGPMEVPGGDRVIVASDAHGIAFGVAAPGKSAS
ncbi:VOC family protein [bacterium]|nr:MAG: VOC family protein [bacterium]